MKKFVLSTALLAVASPALAHTGHGDASGFAHGLVHPLLGADHLLAMLAVGLWSGFALPRRVWAGAAAFLAAMATGAALSWGGVALPMVESWITLSVLVFGVLTVLARPDQSRRVSGAALGAIAAFGLAHGHAHATEAQGNALGYLAGFVLASAGLHLAGIVLARYVAQGRAARLLQHGLGLALAAGGLALLAG